ncbi:short-chain dehydrogenase TIC 32, chloroplastic-like [Bidens hawaiensis]|uniref:short-chain dehydrogenase TIC 32, chloroplastic-like n=1 Tax=Bidens hawaiensis TaxID=980011 RepID=UPI00404B4464
MARKTVVFNWGRFQEEAFEELKKKLTQAPILALPDGNEDLVVYADASYQGIHRTCDLNITWIFCRKAASGFSSSSTAEEVTEGIHASGLTAIVTGATSGIGSESARFLALRGVHVIMAVRSTEKGLKVKESILKETPDAKVDVMELDLSSMASVRDFVAKYCSSGLPLSILINNAGVLSPHFTLSKENIELHFATNHLGHFLLTNLLLETMKTTSYEQNTEGRIINVSSEGHRLSYSGTFSDYINNESSYNSVYAYGLSKLANILHANQLARLLKVNLIPFLKRRGANITTNSLHPGFIDTELFRGHNIFSVICNRILSYVIKDVSQGAASYLALHPKVKGVTGEFFSNGNLAQASSRAKDEELAKELWELSLGLTSAK